MKLILTILIIASTIFAQEFTTKYDVTVGMFGKVGYADATLKEDGSSYEMTLVAKLVGTAASLTGNRVESYISKGKIVDGEYIPETFLKIKTTDTEDEVLTYTFNHDDKTVTLDEKITTVIYGTKFDVASFKIVETKETKNSESSKTLEKYISADILSSYLNTRRAYKEGNDNYDLVAIGARNDRNSITVSILDALAKDKSMKQYADDVASVYNLHVEPFDKDQTVVDIEIAYDNDGLMKEAVLGNSFWFGEIKASRSYHNVATK